MKKYFSILSFVLLCILFIVPEQRSQAFGVDSATLGFAGDIMMHIRVKKCAALNSFDHLFARISPTLESVDVMSGNMEFPVSSPFRSRGIIFNAPEASIPAVKKAGFDVVTIANNHMLDQGEKGLFDTIDYLKKYNLPYIGVGSSLENARQGVVKNIDGIKVGMIGYAGLINYPDRNRSSRFHINWIYQKKRVLEDIRNMKAQCDYLVLQVHTGVEYVLQPRQSDRLLFQEYLDAGVDLIIGHHPHMLQSMEQYHTRDGRKTTIFYSLGNFISDQSRSVVVRGTGRSLSIKSSAIIKLVIKRSSGKISDSFEVVPIHTVHEYTEKDGVRYKNIQTVPLADLIAENSDKKLTAFYSSQVRAVRDTLFVDGKPANVSFVE